MNYNKGDLVLVKKLDNTNITCIILAHFDASEYLYCYCIEESLYKLIYRTDIVCVLAAKFAPDFPDDHLFDLDYSFYSACYEAYHYYPSQVPIDDEDDED